MSTPVRGVDDAGFYGKTQVFTGRGAVGERTFADRANLATVTGGRPAALPSGMNRRDLATTGGPVRALQPGGRTSAFDETKFGVAGQRTGEQQLAALRSLRSEGGTATDPFNRRGRGGGFQEGAPQLLSLAQRSDLVSKIGNKRTPSRQKAQMIKLLNADSATYDQGDQQKPSYDGARFGLQQQKFAAEQADTQSLAAERKQAASKAESDALYQSIRKAGAESSESPADTERYATTAGSVLRETGNAQQAQVGSAMHRQMEAILGRPVGSMDEVYAELGNQLKAAGGKPSKELQSMIGLAESFNSYNQ